MEFKDRIAVITGGAQGIGRCIADEFRKSGATVCVIDKQPGDHFVGDIADRLFKLFFADGASIVNSSSSRDRMSQPQTESNTSAKGSIAALTHALAVSLAGNQMIYHGDNGWRLE